MKWWGWWRRDNGGANIPDNATSSPVEFASGVSSSPVLPTSSPSLRPTIAVPVTGAQLLSVTEADLEQVRPEEVSALLQTLTPLELEQSLRIMLEYQRFGDVMNACPPSTLREARAQVTNAHKLVLRPIFSEKLSLLYGVLPFIPSHYLGDCDER